MHGSATVSNPQGYLVVYGVKDWSDSVDPRIYDDSDDAMFEDKNGDMQMQVDLDLNNNNILNASNLFQPDVNGD